MESPARAFRLGGAGNSSDLGKIGLRLPGRSPKVRFQPILRRSSACRSADASSEPQKAVSRDREARSEWEERYKDNKVRKSSNFSF